MAESFEFHPASSHAPAPNQTNVSASPNPDNGNRTARGAFAYLDDNHTSVLGMRELASIRGATTRCLTPAEVEAYNCRPLAVPEPDVVGSKHSEVLTNHLFAFPAQSNFSGERYPLSWINRLREERRRGEFGGRVGRWFVIVDAASLLTTSTLDLGCHAPDFVTLSFYKMFGFPTGLGNEYAWFVQIINFVRYFLGLG